MHALLNIISNQLITAYAVLAHYPAIFQCYAFVTGAIFGSFLNVVVYRLPIMISNRHQSTPTQYKYNIATPRSACTKCFKKISLWQNIPVLSYLFLRGKCANCKTEISQRYLLVELGLAFYFCLAAIGLGMSFITLALWVFSFLMLCICLLIFDTQRKNSGS